jgi:sulfur relay (sulfurtransferase) complex TusBCD TusD component (DsrE family)
VKLGTILVGHTQYKSQELDQAEPIQSSLLNKDQAEPTLFLRQDKLCPKSIQLKSLDKALAIPIQHILERLDLEECTPHISLQLEAS